MNTDDEDFRGQFLFEELLDDTAKSRSVKEVVTLETAATTRNSRII
jgi:hypothetical protein